MTHVMWWVHVKYIFDIFQWCRRFVEVFWICDMDILYIGIFGCYNHKKTKSWNRTNVQCSNCDSIFDGFLWLLSRYQCILHSMYKSVARRPWKLYFSGIDWNDCLGIFQNWNESSIWFWLFLCDIIFVNWFIG